MKVLFGFLTAWAMVLGCSGVCNAQQAISLTRTDQKLVSVVAYAPKLAHCNGIAVISPGAGGSEQGYRYLAEAITSLGYLAVVTGHPESGMRALRGHLLEHGIRRGLAELITEPEAYRGRFMDIAVAKHWAQAQCGSSESILIGHSMGAATAMMEAGARNKVGVNGMNSFAAYIALSPQGTGLIFPEHAWTDIKEPTLLLTGTRDTELGGGSWQTRTEPFNNMPAGCKWLGVIDGASHMNFAGIGQSRSVEALTVQTIGAFLDGVHRGDCRLPNPIKGIEIETK